jgi:hypothetical protein
MRLNKEEADQIAHWDRVIIQDSEGSFWEWDRDNNRYYILGLDGVIIRDYRSPGAHRPDIEQLYGATTLVQPHTPLQKSISTLQQELRNAYIID